MNIENDIPSLVDEEFFESRREVGEDFVNKLVSVFSLEAPKLIAKVKTTAQANDKVKLAELGHKLKGMCLNVGAVRLSKIGKDIENHAQTGNSEILTSLISCLDNVLDETVREMKNLI